MIVTKRTFLASASAAIGGLALEALALAEGEWRMLDDAERARLGA